MSLRRVLCAFVAAASLSNAASTQTVTDVATATDAASTLTVTSTSTPTKTGHQTLEQPSREGPTPTLPSGFVSNPNPTEGLPRMEVDIIFPHNKTYWRPDNGILPLALSVQNFAKIASMGLPADTVTFSWMMLAVNDTGAVPQGPYGNRGAYAYFQGSFSLYEGATSTNKTTSTNETDSDSNVFVGYANLTQFANVTTFGLQVVTEWAANNATGVCGFGEYNGGVQGSAYHYFSLADMGSDTKWYRHPNATVGEATGCPVYAMFVEPQTREPFTKTVISTTKQTEASTTMTSYAISTTTCSVQIHGYSDTYFGNPCEVTADESVRSAMDTAIASIASSDASYAAAHPTTAVTTGSKNAAPLMTGLPLVPVLAAGVAYGIVF